MKDEKHATAFTVEVVIEIPQGSRNKFECDDELHAMRLDRRIPSAASFPTTYAFVPNTRAADGDALDALVVIDGPVYPGVHVTGSSRWGGG